MRMPNLIIESTLTSKLEQHKINRDLDDEVSENIYTFYFELSEKDDPKKIQI